MQPIDLTHLKTDSLLDRPSKVSIHDLGRPVSPSASISDWIESLPNQLAANELRRLRDELYRCHQEQRTVAVAIGGHVIKVGCAPYLIDWIQRGIIQSISMNGSAAIHDFELAYAGKTSEDVAAQLATGSFGMARETAEAFVIASNRGAESGKGLGYTLGEYIHNQRCPYSESSLVYAAYRAGIPCTIHVALGTDIVHMHPQVSGAALGESSLIDFRILCQVVSGMQEGLWLNIGSAVVMPEVFLKALSVAKNLGSDLSGLVTANLDKEAKYRTKMNVLSRPSAKGIEIIGHHELLLPLIHSAIMAKWMNQPQGIAA
jgi:deoxyhypusine synthase